MKVNLSFLFIVVFWVSLSAQNGTPYLSKFRVTGSQTSRVYFESSVPLEGSSSKGFKILGKSITGVSINSGSTSGHYFTVSSPFTFWDNNTILYDGGSNIRSDKGVTLEDFPLEYIENQIREPEGSGRTYYVSTQGRDSNSGLSESSPWRTIVHAGLQAKAGDIVYIKAGDYGSDRVSIKNNGTSSSPIKFIGYDQRPGDTPRLTRTQDTRLNSSVMPLIHTSSTSGVGLSGSKKSYVIVKNLQLQGYKDAVDFEDAQYCLLQNVYVKGSTRFNILAMDSKSTKFIGCYSANAGNSGIRYSGLRTLVDDMYVSSRGNPNMDYLISLYGSDDGVGSIIINSQIIADPKDSHSQHGLSIKADDKKLEQVLCENIYIQDVEQPIEVRHHEVAYSVFRNIQCKQVRATSERSAGIVILNGAHHNIFDNITVDGNYASIWFASSSEDKEAPDTGHDNIIMNSTFRNGRYVIRMAEDNYNKNRPLYNNYIINCTFYNHDNLYWNAHPRSRDNEFINCVFEGLGKEKVESKGSSSGWDISYSASWNVSWLSNGKSFSGTGNISADPRFENPQSGNFRLQSNSKLINAGRKDSRVSRDIDGNPRPQGSSHDIGAYEYHDNSTTRVDAEVSEDQEICLGEEITLTASGGSDYLWSTGERSSTIRVRPDSTTRYTVEVSEAGASDEASVVVTVHEVKADAGSDVTIDYGSTVTLEASGGESYLWSTGETTSSIEVSPEETQVYTVTVTDGSCESTDEVRVTVDANTSGEDINENDPVEDDKVVADAGPDQSICYGEVIQLSANGGEKYLWSTGETSRTINVSPLETTRYSVEVTSGPNSDVDDVLVEVIRVQADAGKDITISRGETVKLTAKGGDTFLWSTGENSRSISVSPLETVEFTVTAYRSGCQDADSVRIIVEDEDSDLQPLIADAGENQSICIGDSIELTGRGGETYLWSTGENSKTIEVSPTRTTTYSLEVSRDGEKDTDSVTVVVENCDQSVVQIEENHLENALVYPNPASESINIQLRELNHSDLDLFLFDAKGSMMFNESIKSDGSQINREIDVSRLTRGVYFLKLINIKEEAVKKIVVI